MKRSVEVRIGGQPFVLRSDADDGYLRALGALVNQKMEELSEAGRTLPMERLAMLCAINLADDLLKERRNHQELRRLVLDKGKRILAQVRRLAQAETNAGRAEAVASAVEEIIPALPESG